MASLSTSRSARGPLLYILFCSGKKHRSGAYHSLIIPDINTPLTEDRKYFAFKKMLLDILWHREWCGFKSLEAWALVLPLPRVTEWKLQNLSTFDKPYVAMSWRLSRVLRVQYLWLVEYTALCAWADVGLGWRLLVKAINLNSKFTCYLILKMRLFKNSQKDFNLGCVRYGKP